MWIFTVLWSPVFTVPFVKENASDCMLRAQQVTDMHPLSEIRSWCEKNPSFICMPKTEVTWFLKTRTLCRADRHLNDVQIYKEFMGLIPSPPPPPDMPPYPQPPSKTRSESDVSESGALAITLCGLLTGLVFFGCLFGARIQNLCKSVFALSGMDGRR